MWRKTLHTKHNNSLTPFCLKLCCQLSGINKCLGNKLVQVYLLTSFAIWHLDSLVKLQNFTSFPMSEICHFYNLECTLR